MAENIKSQAGQDYVLTGSFLYKIAYAVVYPLFSLLYGVKISGRGNLPKSGAIICSNHTDNIDPIFAALATGPSMPLNFMAKTELFKHKLIGAFLRGLGAFPVNRRERDVGAIKRGIEILKRGGRLLMFPEGTRVKNHEIDGEVKAGISLLAMKSGCPLVPVYITGNKKMFRKKTLIIIGEPITADASAPDGPADYKELASRVFAEILKLGGTDHD